MSKSTASILMPMIRQHMPSLLASQIVGVQPMTGTIGQIFNMKNKYSSNYNYLILKSWTAGRGRRMHRVQVRYQVLEWLREEYDQSQEQTPSWWLFQGHVINVTEDMMMILRLRWAG